MGKEKIIAYLRKLVSKAPEFAGQAGYYIVDSDQAHFLYLHKDGGWRGSIGLYLSHTANKFLWDAPGCFETKEEAVKLAEKLGYKIVEQC